MGAINIPAAAFSKALDEAGHLADLADRTDMDDDWSGDPQIVSDEEIERFIADLAAFGVYEDDLGATKHASPLTLAVARQWVQDKDFVGELIGPAFWREMKAAVSLARFGRKPRFQAVFCSQCGNGFGPGESGFSCCKDHQHLTARTA